MIMPANYAKGTDSEDLYEMWHNCDNLKELAEEYITEEQKSSIGQCKCSLLELFFRNS